VVLRLLLRCTEMQRTREEVTALLKQSEKQLRESGEIQRRLRAVRTRIDRVLGTKAPVRRKGRSRRRAI
jgi:hypothetical protein